MTVFPSVEEVRYSRKRNYIDPKDIADVDHLHHYHAAAAVVDLMEVGLVGSLGILCLQLFWASSPVATWRGESIPT